MSEIVPVFGFSLDLLRYRPEPSERSQFYDLLKSLERKITENPFVFIFNFRSKGSFKNLLEYLKDVQTPNTPIIDLLLENQKVGAFKKQFVEIFHIKELENVDSSEDFVLEHIIQHILSQNETQCSVTQKLSHVDYFFITEAQKKIIRDSTNYTEEQRNLLFKFIITLGEAKESGFLDKWEGELPNEKLEASTEVLLKNIQNLFYYSQNLYMIDDFIQSDQRPYRNINLFFESFFENEKRALLEKGNNYNPERNLFIVRFETVNVSGQKRLLFRNKEQKSEDLSIIKSFCKEIVEKIDEQNLNDFAKGCFLMFLKVQHKRGVVGDFSYIIHEGYQDKDKDGTWYDYSLSNYRSFKMQWEKRYKPTCFAIAELKRGILAINPYDDANCRYDKLLREGRHEFNKGDKIEKESHKLFV